VLLLLLLLLLQAVFLLFLLPLTCQLKGLQWDAAASLPEGRHRLPAGRRLRLRG